MQTTINIKFAKLLDPYMRDWIQLKYPDYVFPTLEEVKEKTKLFRAEWDKNGQKILQALYDATGFEFKRNIIDVYIVSATNRDMSAPLIIRSRYTAQEFIEVITHELIHVLFGDNNFHPGFEEENSTTRNHIYLYAILKHIYLDLLKQPEIFQKEITKYTPENLVLHPVNADYARAWQIVEEKGYMNLIKEVKDFVK